MKYIRETPCVYKHTCGYEICMLDECPEYIAKKRGMPWYEDDPERYHEMEKMRKQEEGE